MTLLSLPAVVALLAKIGLLSLVHRKASRSREAFLFLVLLYAMAAQNVAEVVSFYTPAGAVGEVAWLPAGYAYFAASIAIIALLAHLALVIANGGRAAPRAVVLALYVSAAVLEFLLLFTPWLVAGFEPHRFTYTRLPGPAYGLFSAFCVIGLGGMLAVLGRSSLFEPDAATRRKSRLVLLGIAPLALLAIAVVVTQALGLAVISTPVLLAVTMTFFLAVVGYAIYETELFDLTFQRTSGDEAHGSHARRVPAWTRALAERFGGPQPLLAVASIAAPGAGPTPPQSGPASQVNAARQSFVATTDVKENLETVATRLASIERTLGDGHSRTPTAVHDARSPPAAGGAEVSALPKGSEVTDEIDMDSALDAFSVAVIDSQQPLAQTLAQVEVRLLSEALERSEWNKAAAARLLGVRANTLHYKIARHALFEPDAPAPCNGSAGTAAEAVSVSTECNKEH